MYALICTFAFVLVFICGYMLQETFKMENKLKMCSCRKN